jgi:cytochrome oxidase assembly protein ShyY1
MAPGLVAKFTLVSTSRTNGVVFLAVCLLGSWQERMRWQTALVDQWQYLVITY